MAKTGLVVSAHSADFVWRAGGAIALHAARGIAMTVVCLSYGERGESAKLWRESGMTLDRVKTARQRRGREGRRRAGRRRHPVLGPRRLSDAARRRRRSSASPISTASCSRPSCSPTRARTRTISTIRPRARSPSTRASSRRRTATSPARPVLGAPPVFLFEPHQPEQCDWKPTCCSTSRRSGTRSARRSSA